MTARQLFEGALIECSKQNAPSLLLGDFNYFMNKAVNIYINKHYNVYDVNQQSTDDLRVLKATAILSPTKAYSNTQSVTSRLSHLIPSLANLQGATYEVDLPADYLHLLNCICVYRMKKTYKCYDSGSYVQFAAKRLTADSWSTIINDFYQRPKPERPYYYIHNVNQQSNALPTDIYDANTGIGTDQHNSSVPQCIANPLNLKFSIDTATQTAIPLENVDFIYEALQLKMQSSEQITALKNSFPIKYSIDNRHLYFTCNGDNYYMWIKVSDLNTIHLFTAAENPQNPGNTAGNLNEYVSLQLIDVTAQDNEFPRSISLTLPNQQNGSALVSLVEKHAYLRHANPSTVRCEIRYGKDTSVFELEQVIIDYLKAPQVIRLTQEQIDATEDYSQILEYPDYVCQEIINELVHLVMENTADPRLQTHIPVTQSIANPLAQAQTQQS